MSLFIPNISSSESFLPFCDRRLQNFAVGNHAPKLGKIARMCNIYAAMSNSHASYILLQLEPSRLPPAAYQLLGTEGEKSDC